MIYSVGVADETANSESSEQVLLKDDGTWEYLKADGSALSIYEWFVTVKGVDYNANRYSNEAHLTLKVKNETTKTIRAWRLNLILTSVFGDELAKLQLTCGNSKILPGSIGSSIFVFDDNSFIDDQPYDYLTAYNRENLSLVINDMKVVFEEPQSELFKDEGSTKRAGEE